MNNRPSASGVFATPSTSSNSFDTVIDIHQASLTTLPPEILVQVICQQDVPSVLRLSQTSQKFNNICKQSIRFNDEETSSVAIRMGIFKAQEQKHRISGCNRASKDHWIALTVIGAIVTMGGLSVFGTLFFDDMHKARDQYGYFPMLGAVIISIAPGGALSAFGLMSSCLNENKKQKLEKIKEEKTAFIESLQPRMK